MLVWKVGMDMDSLWGLLVIVLGVLVTLLGITAWTTDLTEE